MLVKGGPGVCKTNKRSPQSSLVAQITAHWMHKWIPCSSLLSNKLQHSPITLTVGLSEPVRYETWPLAAWAFFHYPKRRLIVRSHKVSKPWHLYLELYNCSEIWLLLLMMCLLSFKVIWWFKLPISWLRDLTRYYDKTSYRILIRSHGL